jgi:sugar fermentation stimulation protein A
MIYQWIKKPVSGLFLQRLNRFAALVDLDGTEVKVHLPNSGRLEELLVKGAPVIIEKRRDKGMTHHDLLLISTQRYPDKKPIWAVLDSRMPPKLLRWLIEHQLVPGIKDVISIKNEPEPPNGKHL